MTGKLVAASRFKAECLRLIQQMQKDGEPVTVTRRGAGAAPSNDAAVGHVGTLDAAR